MFRHIAVAAFLLATLAARPSFADVAGPATVVDGDTIVVAGERVRLQGIDAPEFADDVDVESVQRTPELGHPITAKRASLVDTKHPMLVAVEGDRLSPRHTHK